MLGVFPTYSETGGIRFCNIPPFMAEKPVNLRIKVIPKNLEMYPECYPVHSATQRYSSSPSRDNRLSEVFERVSFPRWSRPA